MPLDLERILSHFETPDERRRRLNTPSNWLRLLLLWLIWLPFLVIGGDDVRFMGAIVAFGTVILLMGVLPMTLRALGVTHPLVVWLLDLDRRKEWSKFKGPSQKS